MTRWLRLKVSPAQQQRSTSAFFQRWNAGEEGCSAEFSRRADGGFLLRFHGIADFVVDPSTSAVECVPVRDADVAWQGIYEQQVQPLLLSLRGEQVFHGGAIAVGDAAVAFLAPSGAGKSTLTTAFAKRGYAFLSDDCLHLDFAQPRIHVHPHAAHVRLWEDSVAALGEGRSVYVEGSPKPRLEAATDLPHCDRALPLARVYLLGEGKVDAPAIETLSPSQALIGLAANAFVLDIKNPSVLKRNLAAGARLVREVPLRRLDYPRRYDALESVVAAVLADVAG
ncbi:MAG: hypothetical protein KGL91_02590 [Xanthomonadaceae bacterium]|nr:hypothetical protein [Xanthomonadaceae bacterium]